MMGCGSLEQHKAAPEVARITQKNLGVPKPRSKLTERRKERVEILKKSQTRPEVVHTLLFTYHWLKWSQRSHLTLRESGKGSGLSLFDDIGFIQMFNNPCANSL